MASKKNRAGDVGTTETDGSGVSLTHRFRMSSGASSEDALHFNWREAKAAVRLLQAAIDRHEAERATPVPR